MSSHPLKTPVDIAATITAVEMHTAGETVRIIQSGFPVPQGKTVVEKMDYLKHHCDEYRKFVMWEPRGHREMFGAVLVSPDHPEADVAVIYFHHDGYATMCGHMTIALARYVIDQGLIRRPIVVPETDVKIQTACGLITASVQVQREGNLIRTGRACFESVPAFVVVTDYKVEVDGVGSFEVDLVFGGNFFAYVAASDIGVDFEKTSEAEMKQVSFRIETTVRPLVKLSHPTVPTCLAGVIVVDSRKTLHPVASTNVSLYGKYGADRSPCGSGTTGLVALMHHQGQLAIGQRHTFRNGLTGSEFKAWAVEETKVGENKAVTVKVEGHGFYCGKTVLDLEKGDDLGVGFSIQ